MKKVVSKRKPETSAVTEKKRLLLYIDLQQELNKHENNLATQEYDEELKIFIGDTSYL